MQSLNPAYVQISLNGSRNGWPFSEPSYASVWFACLFMGGLALYLFSQRWLVGLAFMCGGLIAVINSMGTSGLASGAMGSLVLLLSSVAVAIRKPKNRKPIGLRIALLSLIAGLSFGSYHFVQKSHPHYLPDIHAQILDQLKPRIEETIKSEGVRSRSNQEALQINQDTWGLGAGLGSNRASSYLLSALSTIGIPGLTLIVVLIVWQSVLLLRQTNIPASTIFVVSGTIGAAIGVNLGTHCFRLHVGSSCYRSERKTTPWHGVRALNLQSGRGSALPMAV